MSFSESPLDLSIPLISASNSSHSTNNALLCNPLKLNISTELNYNEGRNSVAYSEDSGISSSNGEDTLLVPAVKCNSHSPSSPSKLPSSIYNLSPNCTIQSKESFPKVNYLNLVTNFETNEARPNSATSSASNISDNEQTEVESRLTLPEEKILEVNQTVSLNRINCNLCHRR